MTVQVDKWVAAGIAAVNWSGLADMSNPAAVADLCEFLGFNVAYLWIRANPQAYLWGLEQGFEPFTPLPREQAEHALQHAAMVLRENGNELAERADSATAQRLLAALADRLSEAPDENSKPAARSQRIGGSTAQGFAGAD